MIRVLKDAGIPVLLTLSQVPVKDGERHPDTLEFADAIADLDLPLALRDEILLNAAPDDPWSSQAH